MNRIIVFALIGHLSFVLTSLAHHHHTDPGHPRMEMASEVIFLAEFAGEPVAPAARPGSRAVSRMADGDAAVTNLSCKGIALLIGEGFHDGKPYHTRVPLQSPAIFSAPPGYNSFPSR